VNKPEIVENFLRFLVLFISSKSFNFLLNSRILKLIFYSIKRDKSLYFLVILDWEQCTHKF
jgi:hypothetical protein